MILVALEDVYKDYVMAKTRVPVLKGVSLQLAAGEMACLMGPSGSGKTTILNIIGGIDFAGRGRVSVYNQALAGMSDKRLSEFRNKTLGFIFQYFNLIPVLTAFENIEYPLVLQGVDKRERRRRVAEMLEAVGLAAVKNHRPDELSGGQQRCNGVPRRRRSWSLPMNHR